MAHTVFINIPWQNAIVRADMRFDQKKTNIFEIFHLIDQNQEILENIYLFIPGGRDEVIILWKDKNSVFELKNNPKLTIRNFFPGGDYQFENRLPKDCELVEDPTLDFWMTDDKQSLIISKGKMLYPWAIVDGSWKRNEVPEWQPYRSAHRKKWTDKEKVLI